MLNLTYFDENTQNIYIFEVSEEEANLQNCYTYCIPTVLLYTYKRYYLLLYTYKKCDLKDSLLSDGTIYST